MRLLLATKNAGKLREVQSLLDGLPLELVSLQDRHIDIDIPETGETFAANAILKARGYARLSGLTTLADDSGLEVDALGGAPGVQSARWAGAGASDRDRIDKLLAELRSYPPERRGAQFHCVVAIATRSRVYTSEGIVRGLIIDQPRGSHGFGYDPVFLLPTLGLTMAEIEPATKNQISHRAQAIRAARPILEALLAGEEKGEAFAQP